MWFSRRERAIDLFRRRPAETQQRMFREALQRGRDTAFGRYFGLPEVRTPGEFRAAVPVFDYESFKPWIDRKSVV